MANYNPLANYIRGLKKHSRLISLDNAATLGGQFNYPNGSYVSVPVDTTGSAGALGAYGAMLPTEPPPPTPTITGSTGTRAQTPLEQFLEAEASLRYRQAQLSNYGARSAERLTRTVGFLPTRTGAAGGSYYDRNVPALIGMALDRPVLPQYGNNITFRDLLPSFNFKLPETRQPPPYIAPHIRTNQAGEPELVLPGEPGQPEQVTPLTAQGLSEAATATTYNVPGTDPRQPIPVAVDRETSLLGQSTGAHRTKGIAPEVYANPAAHGTTRQELSRLQSWENYSASSWAFRKKKGAQVQRQIRRRTKKLRTQWEASGSQLNFNQWLQSPERYQPNLKTQAQNFVNQVGAWRVATG